MRKYPVGIQSFEKVRSEGYVYVDKTALIYKMITEGCPYFLSRPRRFGKSLLVSTLAAVFEGRRELFEAFTTDDGIEQPPLFISTTKWKWEKYPVLRFDFSKSNLTSIEKLDEYIDFTLSNYEQQYNIPPSKAGTSIRMTNIIHAAEHEMGKKVVVLVDEYDNMMLHSLGDSQMQMLVRERFQDLFTPLKGEDDHLQFVFITGISKFSGSAGTVLGSAGTVLCDYFFQDCFGVNETFSIFANGNDLSNNNQWHVSQDREAERTSVT